MKTTITIQDEKELVGFLKSVGTEARFITIRTETVVKMRKTDNPYVGAVKVARRNGIVNVNYVEKCRRNLAELRGTPLKETNYVAGSTWYVHCETADGKPLPVCVDKKTASKYYLQYFPLRNLGEVTYWLNGKQLAPNEVTTMKTFVPDDKREEFKPTVLTFAMSSIREFRCNNVAVKNDLVSKVVDRHLSRLANKTDSIFEKNQMVAA